jgi:hypothetical protein
MPSQFDDELTPIERTVLRMYRSPQASGMGRTAMISFMYAISAGVFVYATIAFNEPRYSLIVYGLFLYFMAMRLFGGSKLAGVMPSIIEKYEHHIADCKSRIAAGHPLPPSQ